MRTDGTLEQIVPDDEVITERQGRKNQCLCNVINLRFRSSSLSMQTATFGGHQGYIRRSARDPSPAANRYAAKGSLHE